MTLSKESEQFIGNLRAYLMTSGKREKEVLEIVEEVESHLIEAEEHGKSVQDIIGQSPKAYMESIGKEMKTDVKQSVVAGLAILFGAFSIAIFPDIIQGELSFTLFRLIGMITVFILFIVAIVITGRTLSKQNATDRKSIVVITIFMMFPMFIFLGLFLLDDMIASPRMSLQGIPVFIIGAIVLCFLIGLSIWSKTWILILVVGIMAAPKLFQKVFSWTDEWTLYATLGFYVLLFFLIFNTIHKSKNKAS